MPVCVYHILFIYCSFGGCLVRLYLSYCKNKHGYTSISEIVDLEFFGKYPGGEIAVLYSRSSFGFLKNCPTDFHNGWTIYWITTLPFFPPFVSLMENFIRPYNVSWSNPRINRPSSALIHLHWSLRTLVLRSSKLPPLSFILFISFVSLSNIIEMDIL